ncbi:hypothetical protein PRZ61_10790 [Halomonas pacifica]|uniref:hypothetical protein n=1 Tax=Bisbaumannia pacifica TaxID=77098 RepID=UPI002358A1FC|nr:hypothetical protein [Halomonas pacifica]MDC8803922.1 hypothetical protein [Halomonas pacifica]
MIITDPKLAWAMAMDSGVRSQLGPIMEDLESGGRVQYSTRGGAGASHGAEYTPIYSRIRHMEREAPALAAVGHVLCHPCTEQANGHLDEAVAAVQARVIALIPNWSDGKAWRTAKKERVHWLIHVALMERQRNLANDQPAWRPERIGEMMREWYGMSIVTRDWARDWLPAWSAIQASIDYLESEAMEPISDTIGEVVRKFRCAA